jgi:2-isopropylmalate synthase
MTHEEKLEIAGLLDEMGVDIIEAGFPIASEGDFAAVSEIAKRAKNSTICGLARANFKDIDRCWEAVPREIPPHPHLHRHLAPAPRDPEPDMDQMAERIHETVTHASNLCDNVQWSPMDATRTEHDYLCRVVEIAIKAGATTINIPDTVGYTYPMESREDHPHAAGTGPGRRPDHLRHPLPQRPRHGDRERAGRGRGGARQIECTINGLGERAGNTALEEVVMAMRSGTTSCRSDRHRHDEDHEPLPPGQPPSRAFRSSSTRPSSARTPSCMKAASIRTAC